MRKYKFLLTILLINISIGLFSYERVFYGVASYYGKKFHGRKTASGEIFNMYKLTGAHKTLPLGSLVKVTNLKNNRSLVIKINDRGPYVGNRILDLSFAAARKLGYIRNGLTKVKAEIIYLAPKKRRGNASTPPSAIVNEEENNMPPADNPGNENNSNSNTNNAVIPAPGGNSSSSNANSGGRILRIQLGAFKNRANALKRVAKLKEIGVNAEIVEIRTADNYFHKVYSVEKYRVLKKAFKKLSELRKKGIECFIIGQYYARSSE